MPINVFERGHSLPRRDRWGLGMPRIARILKKSETAHTCLHFLCDIAHPRRA